MARKIVKFKDYLEGQLQDPEFKKRYDAYDLPVRIALTIAALRRDRRMSQVDLARRMGVTQQMVAHLEDPNGSPPTVRTLQKVARAFGKSLDIAFH